MSKKYNDQIYELYEKEVEKNRKLSLKYEKLRFEVEDLRYQNKILQKKVDEVDNLIEKAVTKAVEKVSKYYEEKIDELETIIKVQAIEIDRLRNQINKNSSNSSKPSSTDLNKTKTEKKTSANEYNYRKMSRRKNGGQEGHKGYSLTKRDIEEVIKNSNIEVREIIHNIKGKDTIKYRVGIEIKTFIEKHIFKHKSSTKESLPKEFYTDVTYDNSIKNLCVELGGYNLLSYERITDFLNTISKGVLRLSQGTINNFYKEFSLKSKRTLQNITDNLMNGKVIYTDETTSKFDGSNMYFRNYSNEESVIYKAHKNKGHKPIIEDNVLTNYYGNVMGDHDTTLQKYGNKNLECNIHTGRYLEEIHQNVYETYWQYEMKSFLFRLNETRKIAICYGLKYFDNEEIKKYEEEYDRIISKAIEENQNIQSSYYKKKAEKLVRRLIKYKDNQLYFIKDFEMPFDDNLSERDLRMIKGKTKISGGFRSMDGARAYADMMSIIKTSKKRKLNPYDSIDLIFQNKVLFG